MIEQDKLTNGRTR